MDPDAETYNITFKIILVLILLLLSAFFSSAETAFMTSNKIKLRQMLRPDSKKYLLVEKLLNNKDKMLSAILIGNNAVNMFISSITSTLVYELFGNLFVSIATAIITIVILIFGEITPKTVANKNPEKILSVYAPVMYIMIYVLTPIIFFVNGISYIIMRLFGVSIKTDEPIVTEETLKTLVDVGQEEGIIEEEEHKLIQNVFEFGESCAKDIMIPAFKICSIQENSTYEEIMNVFKSEKYTRLVIFDELKQNVVGIINLRDIIHANKDKFDIKSIIRKPLLTYEHKKISDLLKEMKSTSNNMAIVIDEYGTTVGLLTLEDILEEIVGEIRDEYDEDELTLVKQLSENVFEIDATLKLIDINRQLELNLESEDYDTIGGYMIQKLDKMPEEKDLIEDDSLIFEILKIDNNRIISIKLTKKQQN